MNSSSSSSSSSREKEQLNEPVEEKGSGRKDDVETRDEGLLGGRRVGGGSARRIQAKRTDSSELSVCVKKAGELRLLSIQSY